MSAPTRSHRTPSCKSKPRGTRFVFDLADFAPAMRVAGSRDRRSSLLGGKGANLAGMTSLGLPVPSGLWPGGAGVPDEPFETPARSPKAYDQRRRVHGKLGGRR